MPRLRGAVRGPARAHSERVAHVGGRLRLSVADGSARERPCSARRRGASTPPTPSSASGRRAPPRSTSSASGAPASGAENSAGANQGAIEDVLECLSDASQISFTFQVSPRSLHDVSWDSPAPSLQPTPESRPPTRLAEPHRSEETRDHTMQSVTLGIALCAVVLGVAGGVLLMRPRTSQVDPGLRAWLSGLDPGDARWPQMAGVAGQSVEVQVARCPTNTAVASRWRTAARCRPTRPFPWPRPSQSRCQSSVSARAERRGRGRRRGDGRALPAGA